MYGLAVLRQNNLPSPGITHLSWGQMKIDGFGSGKDFKLWPGGARKWDWSETGTSHNPGIQPADVSELIENGSEIIVLSRGMLKRLQTSPETLSLLKEKGIQTEVKATKEAVDIYNKLSKQGKAVGGLFHSTC